MNKLMRTAKTLLPAAIALLALWLVPCAHSTLILTPLVKFDGTNGGSCYATLVQGDDGNLYGTTFSGTGTSGYGTVFRVAPEGGLTTLVRFNGTSGAWPVAGLVLASDGNFYGTTAYGGESYTGPSQMGYGSVFRMTSNGVLTTLFSFSGTNGAYPGGKLIQATDSNLYGTTADFGNQAGFGTVFQLTTNGQLSTLARFNGANGNWPASGLLQGADGSFYGTTFMGGANNLGTVFQLTTNGTLVTLVSFAGANGANPSGSLIQAADGSFYGATSAGGANNLGSVFQLSANGSLATLVSFNNDNGANPHGALLQASDGNLYGTTSGGGVPRYGQGSGTIFRLTTNGVLTQLIAFNIENGAQPGGGLLQSGDGNFYGTTVGYNSSPGSGGEVFRLSPAVPPVIEMVARTNGMLQFSWTALPEQSYAVQYQSNLSGTNWNWLAASFSVTNGIATVSDFIGADPQRFYRVVLFPY